MVGFETPQSVHEPIKVYIRPPKNTKRREFLMEKYDFVDLVAVGFGLIILGAIIAAYFMGMELDVDMKSWFFAILTFFIGKKMPQTFGGGKGK